MKTNIGENIKFYRKQKNFTQEQLAEAMGVSVGAVSKWEGNLSVPEVGLIMELADFFEISVDTILGYKMKSNAAEESAKRIHNFYVNKEFESGAVEAEKAVQKYPNNFAVIYRSAILFFLYGFEKQSEKLLLRSKELLEHALVIYDPDQDFCNGKTDIYESLADVYLSLNKPEKYLEILKEHNELGVFSYRIGCTLATENGDTKEALRYLSDALVTNLAHLTEIALGFANVYEKIDKPLVFDILSAAAEFYEKFHIEGKSSFLDRGTVLFHVACAQYYESIEDEENARNYLLKAKEVALRFDENPDDTARNIKFYKKDIPAVASQSVSATALGTVERMIDEEKNPLLVKIWEEIKKK